MGCTHYDFLHYSADLTQLVHQINLVVKPACGVHQYYASTVADSLLYCRIGNRCRVGVHALLHEGGSRAVGPNSELVYCRGTECVCCTQYHRMAFASEFLGKLAYGSGFAYAVDPDHQNHHGLACGNIHRLNCCPLGKLISQFISNELFKTLFVDVLVLSHPCLDRFYQSDGCFYSHVGRNQRFFEGIEGRGVHNRFAAKQFADPSKKGFLGFSESKQ